MAFNKLRRAIEQEQQATYDAPHLKIAAQSTLLARVLVALGGPVPPQVTGVLSVANTSANEAVIIGRDTGDETEYVAGLGTPNKCDVSGNYIP